MKKMLLSLAALGLLAMPAQADWFSIDQTAGTDPYTGTDVVVNDCCINTHGGEWLSSLIYVELTSGEVFHDPRFDMIPWGKVGDLNPYDSCLAEGVHVFGHGDEAAAMAIMSGDPWNAAISMTCYGSLPDDWVPPWDGLAARLSFTPDAEGFWTFWVSIGNPHPPIDPGSDYDSIMYSVGAEAEKILYFGRIQGGRMVPEPNTLFLAAVGLVSLFYRRLR